MSVRQFETENYTPPPGFVSHKGRRIEYGQRVKVYRNLHKNVYSIADAESGLVLGYCARVTLTDAEFKVSEAGRQRVLREKRKNVHAYVVGTFVATAGATQRRAARYNPYEVATFVTSAGEPIYEASIVTLEHGGVTYSEGGY